MFINFLLYFTTFYLLSIILYKTHKQKYLIVTSLCFWFIFFYFCYISFSCLFVDIINSNWDFSETTLKLTKLLVSFYNIAFGTLYAILGKADFSLKNKIEVSKRYSFTYKVAKFIEALATIILVYAIYTLLNYRVGKNFSYYNDIRFFAGELSQRLHIRLFLYLLISSSFYLYLKSKKLKYFLPLILVVCFESLAGQRTTAFIVLLYLYVFYAISKKKLALKVIIPLLVFLIVGVLFSRAAFLNSGNSSLQLTIVFGEFFETFTTIPFIIEKSLIGANFNFERFVSEYTFLSFVPGSIKQLNENYISIGEEIADIIRRGYGLGSNFITSSLYEFGVVGFFIIPFFFLTYFALDKRLKGCENLVLKIVFIFQARLFIREGIPQFMVAFYIILIYVAFFYFLSKKKKCFIFMKKEVQNAYKK